MLLKSEILQGNQLSSNAPIFKQEGSKLVFNGTFNNQRACFSMSESQLSRHILFLGGTGSGKTNVIIQFIRQLKKSMRPNDIMLIFDSKRDFREFHSSNDCVLTNTGYQGKAKQIYWNLFTEVVFDGWGFEEVSINTDELSYGVFSDSIEKSSQPFFPRAASDVFSAVIKGMCRIGRDDLDYRDKYLNNMALSVYLKKLNASALNEFLKPFPDLSGVSRYVGDGKSQQALGVFGELESITNHLFIKSFGRDSGSSFRRFEKMRNGKTLFIEYDASLGSVFNSVYSVIMDLFLKECLSPDNANGKVYVVVDELKLLPYLNHFEDALNFGRSLGLSVIAGIQSMEQLYEVYGEQRGKNIASAFQNLICMSTNNLASREYIKGVYGQNLISYSYLDSSKQVTNETRIGNVVEDWDISQLQVGEGIVGLAESNPFVFKFGKSK